jgi:fatty-acyl-CoA synthase
MRFACSVWGDAVNRATGLGGWPARAARKAAHRPAMTYADHTTTYAALTERVARLARVLDDMGIRSGSRVAYLGGNHPAFLESLFATASLGAIFVPLNARLSAAEIDFMLDDSGAEALFVGSASAPTVERLDTTGRPRVIAIDAELAGALDYESVIANAPNHPVAVTVDVEKPCLIMYTSGTTGRPKGAILSHHNITWNCVNVLVDLDVVSDEVTLVTAPMFHTAALNMTCLPTLLKGGHLVIEPRFDADSVIETIERMRITLLFGVPTMFAALTQSPKWANADLSSVRLLLCGGAPVPKSLITTYLERGLAFVQGYGMTETAPGALVVDPHLSAETVGAAGVAHFFTDVQLVRDDGSPAAPGEPGEVVIAGPNVMSGYWGLPDATRQAFLDGGWFRSGDVAVADGAGIITIVDRVKDVYISGGENVYPAEVETALCDHPAVVEAAVIGVPDATWGEVGMAYVVLTADGSVTAEALEAHLRTRIAGYKVPRSWIFLDTLPHTASGKVQKSQLRTQMTSQEHPATEEAP